MNPDIKYLLPIHFKRAERQSQSPPYLWGRLQSPADSGQRLAPVQRVMGD